MEKKKWRFANIHNLVPKCVKKKVLLALSEFLLKEKKKCIFV